MPLAPYKCPICEGRGTVLGAFYVFDPSANVNPDDYVECHSCGGEGIVWPPLSAKLRDEIPEVFEKIRRVYEDRMTAQVPGPDLGTWAFDVPTDTRDWLNDQMLFVALNDRNEITVEATSPDDLSWVEGVFKSVSLRLDNLTEDMTKTSPPTRRRRTRRDWNPCQPITVTNSPSGPEIDAFLSLVKETTHDPVWSSIVSCEDEEEP